MDPKLAFQIGDLVEIHDGSLSDGRRGQITDTSADILYQVSYQFGKFNCIKWIKAEELLLVG